MKRKLAMVLLATALVMTACSNDGQGAAGGVTSSAEESSISEEVSSAPIEESVDVTGVETDGEAVVESVNGADVEIIDAEE